MKHDIIIQCGITYQPLTIGISLLEQSYTIGKIYIVTTHTAIEAIDALMARYFSHIPFAVLGSLVSGEGTMYDQNEYAKSLQWALRLAQNPLALIASGTNWISFYFAKAMGDIPVFTVRTRKEFMDKCFFPNANEPLVDEEGNLVQTDDDEPLTMLVPLTLPKEEGSVSMQGSTLRFLGRTVALTRQEAAVMDYLFSCGGIVALNKEHTQSFNAFCEAHDVYGVQRVLMDDFNERIGQIMSKINAKIAESEDPFLQKHLSLIKNDEAIFLTSFQLLF